MDGLGADVSFSKIALLPITGTTTYRVRVRVALLALSTAIWLYAVRYQYVFVRGEAWEGSRSRLDSRKGSPIRKNQHHTTRRALKLVY